MMQLPIVAVSMSDSDLEDLELLQSEGGFSSRSEVVRHAIRSLWTEHQNLEELRGEISIVMTVSYVSKGKDAVCNRVQHAYSDLITALMHSHAADGGCVDVLMTKGSAEKVREFVKNLRSQRHVSQIQVTSLGS
ncbi:CopG family ribbon-helix-helix protein [Candidatus Thorarchaeota archaeon]|nr:MAG: CopG family ribbon-helix-helix protein [Candidatus Thorarchaeota archaeon]